MRWLLFSASAHAALIATLASRAPLKPPPPPFTSTLSIEVQPAPAPGPTGPGGGGEPTAATVAPSRSPSTTRPPRGEPPPTRPVEPGKPDRWLSMRRVAVPDVRASAGQPDGPPPADELPSLGRAPAPPIPGKGPGPLGPDALPDGNGGYRFDKTTFVGRVRRDGTVKLEDKAAFELEGTTVTFDITDMLMRAIGDDPYAIEKLRLLDRTRDARAVMARTDRTERLRQALGRLPKDLAKVWGFDNWSEKKRRRVLFRLWDEVAEDEDPELVRAAAEVRATIYAFIRRHLPAGSPAAFPPEEIEALNRERRSRAVFDPYSGPP